MSFGDQIILMISGYFGAWVVVLIGGYRYYKWEFNRRNK